MINWENYDPMQQFVIIEDRSAAKYSNDYLSESENKVNLHIDKR